MRNTHAVIFDGDDTLWQTERQYDEALELCQEYVGNHGVDPAEWRDLQRQIDVSLVDEFGFSRQRFPTSSVRAWEALSGDSGGARSAEVWRLSDTVFTSTARLVSGAETVLEHLAGLGHRLGLLTKGDHEVQVKRVGDAESLVRHMDVVDIVSSKDAGDFRRVASRLGTAPQDCVAVGNSLRSDVLPSLEAGMRAVWIEAYVWDYERTDTATPVPEGATRLRSITRLPAHLRDLSAESRA